MRVIKNVITSLAALLLLGTISSCVAAADVVTVKSPEDYSKLVADDKVVLVEFYSAYCGSCKEFSKHWHQLEKDFAEKLILARVKIDDSGPMKVAQKCGALSGGIPHVRLLTATDDTSVVLMSGGSGIKKSHVLAAEINAKLASFQTDASGAWLKKASSSAEL